MYDEEDEKWDPQNPSASLSELMDNMLIHSNGAGTIVDSAIENKHWFTGNELPQEMNPLQATFKKKIESLITRIGYHPSTPTTINHVTQLHKFLNCINAGDQPRKRTLVILNKWWKLYEYNKDGCRAGK